jgi:hypothetical protein
MESRFLTIFPQYSKLATTPPSCVKIPLQDHARCPGWTPTLRSTLYCMDCTVHTFSHLEILSRCVKQSGEHSLMYRRAHCHAWGPTPPHFVPHLEIHSRRVKQSGEYSLMWGSSVGTMKACTPLPPSTAAMCRRSAARRSSAGVGAAGAAAMAGAWVLRLPKP